MLDNLDQVTAVWESTAETAAEMTHALCELGGGSMGQGIRDMFTSGMELGFASGMHCGFTSGNAQGFIKGAVAATAVIGGGAIVVGSGILISRALKERKAKELQSSVYKHSYEER